MIKKRLDCYYNEMDGDRVSAKGSPNSTGNPGSVIVPQYGSSKITVFVWGKNTILKFVGNTISQWNLPCC